MGKRPETQEKILEVLLTMEPRSTSEILSELNKNHENSFTFSTIGKPLNSLKMNGYIIENKENGRTIYSLCNDICIVKRLFNDPRYTDLRGSFRQNQKFRDYLIQTAFSDHLPQTYRDDLDQMLQSSRMFFEVFFALQEPRGNLEEYADLLNWYPQPNPFGMVYDRYPRNDENAKTFEIFQMYLFLYASLQIIENEGLSLCYDDKDLSPQKLREEISSPNDTVQKYKQMLANTVNFRESFSTMHCLNECMKLKKSKLRRDKERKKQLESFLEGIEQQIYASIPVLCGGNPEKSRNIKEDMINNPEKLRSILSSERK